MNKISKNTHHIKPKQICSLQLRCFQTHHLFNEQKKCTCKHTLCTMFISVCSIASI